MLATTSHRRERLASLKLPGTVHFGSVPVEPVRRLETGIPSVDELLGGGFPRGSLSEIVGAVSSGRTALMCKLLAAATSRGEVVAVVDLPDALHPQSLGAAGVDLGRVLWARPPSLRIGLKCAELILKAGGFGVLVLDLEGMALRRLPLAVWPRLKRLAKQSQTVVAILAEQRVAGSFAATSLTLARQRVRWTGGAWPLLEGLTPRLTMVKGRPMRTEGRGLRTEDRRTG